MACLTYRHRHADDVAPVPAPFAVGQRVGIVTGVQSVHGPAVTSYGTVVRTVAPWGEVEYVVRGDDGAELVYPAYLLRADDRTPITDDPAADRAARVARGRCVDCDDTGAWDDGTRCPTCRPGASDTGASGTVHCLAHGTWTPGCAPCMRARRRSVQSHARHCNCFACRELRVLRDIRDIGRMS
jgi:hypothetical protein